MTRLVRRTLSGLLVLGSLGFASMVFAQAGGPPQAAVPVRCVNTAGTAFTDCAGAGGATAADNSVFTGGLTGVTPMGALYDTTPPTITDGNVGTPVMDSARRLMMNCVSGCAAAADVTGTPVALNALNVTASVAMSGTQGVGMHLAAGTLAATLTPELSFDGGTTWVATRFYDPATLTTSSTLVFTNPNAATEATILSTGGTSHARVRVSLFTSGAATATLRATATTTASGGSAGGSAFGAALPALGTPIGFSDGTNLQAGRVFDLDSGGGLQYGQGVNLRKIASGGSVEAGTASDPLRVDTTGTTIQPVSGTVTANAGSGIFASAGTIAHDAAGAGVNPLLMGCYASVAAPLDVSADTDATRSWCLRNGSLVTNLAGGGTLITATGTSLNVNITNASAGGTAMVDDAAFTVATTQFTPAGGTYKSTRDLVDDNDGGAFAMTQRRALYTSPETPAGDPMSDETANAMRTMLVDNTGTFITPSAVDASSNARSVGAVAFDAAAGSVDPLLQGCYASAAAPTDVSADNDATRAWCLRNGARATQPTFAGVLAVAGNGVSGTGVQRVTLASDSTGQVAPIAKTSGGTTPYRLVSAATTNAANVKASAGQVYAVIVSNVNAAARYLHLYNNAGAPTCNASIINTFIIPGATTGGGTNIPIALGVEFSSGIGICITTGVDGTGNVAANELVANVFYK